MDQLLQKKSELNNNLNELLSILNNIDLINICVNHYKISRQYITKSFIMCTLIKKNIPIKIHTNCVIVDDKYLLRTSSNITDRSISEFPCDKELGIVLHNHQKVSHLINDLLSQRLNQDINNMSWNTIFEKIHSNNTQYMPIHISRWTYVKRIIYDFKFIELSK